MKQVEYITIEHYDDESGTYISTGPRLNPTGRWMLRTSPDYINLLFIEHKGLIFKSWIPETSIVLDLETTQEIFECHGNSYQKKN